jgi:L-amino acid N-acyltransferase YncA
MAIGVDRLAVEQMTASDWPAVAEIYRQGLDTGDASFETDVPG